jgi:hypothetical protein
VAITSGFYDSLNGDRKYNAAQLSSLFNGIITDGVFSSIGSALVVIANSGFSVTVGAGRAWFNKSWLENDSDYILATDIADVILDRIDIIAIEFNSSPDVRLNTIKYIKGTPATNPVPPEMINTETVHQYPLAHITIPAGVSSITGAMIANKVGSIDCPFITGIVESVDASTLLGEFESEFNIWFDAMKDQLTTDAAGNLQTQINNMDAAYRDADILIQANAKKHKLQGVISNPQMVYLQRPQIILLVLPPAIHIKQILLVSSTYGVINQWTGDLKYADDPFSGSFANSTLILACDANSDGIFSSGNINLAVPASKYIYLQFDASPDIACKDITIKLDYTED